MNQIPNETEKTFNEWLHDKLVIPKPDSIVTSVIEKFSERAQMGKEKYGKTLDRDDLGIVGWICHFQEELMDGILYAEKLKQKMIAIEKDANKLKNLAIKEQKYETAALARSIEREIVLGDRVHIYNKILKND